MKCRASVAIQIREMIDFDCITTIRAFHQSCKLFHFTGCICPTKLFIFSEPFLHCYKCGTGNNSLKICSVYCLFFQSGIFSGICVSCFLSYDMSGSRTVPSAFITANVRFPHFIVFIKQVIRNRIDRILEYSCYCYTVKMTIFPIAPITLFV